MTKLDAIAMAEEFARKALVIDLHQDVSDATIHAVALKIVKAVGEVQITEKPSRKSAQANREQAEA